MSMQMALPITMIPGNSVIHRINPLPKMIWVAGYIVLAFSTQNIVLLYSMALFALILAPVAGVVRPLLKASLILVPVASSLVALQIIAPAMKDDRLYKVGAAVEAAFVERWGHPLLEEAPSL